ncbi:unnamed protein product [Nippostrongylus brasiliensis]|uniref:Uncharacterized protein n=1 Tax=Nippostrongylus brasiliensis TaxID=27835 RepID=A0A158QZH4_NIPBR|nr:unnamed protein product [Nippostrongylus brasiliensis]
MPCLKPAELRFVHDPLTSFTRVTQMFVCIWLKYNIPCATFDKSVQ